MKSVTMLKVLGVCAVSSLSLLGSPAQADGCPSSALSAPVVPFVGANQRQQDLPGMSPVDARMAREMARIESALRAGRITPYQAGRLAREQWELAQFQRGFQDKGQEVGQTMGRGQSCGLNPDMAANLVPLVGNMAKEGIQRASSIMNALAHEVSRLIREEEQANEMTPF
jgi:hypothetical protein